MFQNNNNLSSSHSVGQGASGGSQGRGSGGANYGNGVMPEMGQQIGLGQQGMRVSAFFCAKYNCVHNLIKCFLSAFAPTC